MRRLSSVFAPALLFVIAAIAVCQSKSVWQAVAVPREVADGAASGRNANRIGPAGKRGVWITSLEGKSWVTENGGEAWAANAYPPGVAVEGGLTFVNSDHAWAAGAVSGGAAWMASTSDGGKTWRSTPTITDSRPGSFEDIQFFDKDFGVAVGVANLDEGGRSLVAITHDGGVTWKSQLFEKGDPDSTLMRVRFQSRSVVWAVGGQSIFSSRDSGASWKLVHREPTATQLGAIAVVGSSGIFVTGGWGLVMRSRDFGSTWERLKVPPDVEQRFLYSMDFADSLRGWVGGDHGTIIETQDGGQTWQEEPTGADGLVRDVAVVGDKVYAAGDNFFVLERSIAKGGR